MEATKDAAMRYRSFVLRNRMLVNAAESAIQGLAFLVPVSRRGAAKQGVRACIADCCDGLPVRPDPNEPRGFVALLV